MHWKLVKELNGAPHIVKLTLECALDSLQALGALGGLSANLKELSLLEDAPLKLTTR